MHFSGDFTVGNVIILVVMVFGFGVSWTRIGSDISSIKQWIRQHARLHEKIDTDVEDLKLGFARYEGRQERDPSRDKKV